MLRQILLAFFLIPLLFISCRHPENDIDNNISVYPNPFSRSFSLRMFVESSSEIQVYLLNQSIDEIHVTERNRPDQVITENPIINEESQGENRYELDLSGMDPGIYFLDVVVNGKAERIKLLKMDE